MRTLPPACAMIAPLTAPRSPRQYGDRGVAGPGTPGNPSGKESDRDAGGGRPDHRQRRAAPRRHGPPPAGGGGGALRTERHVSRRLRVPEDARPPPRPHRLHGGVLLVWPRHGEPVIVLNRIA